ncbi:MAG: PDZ domain-containing protein [Acidobacteria bacterium]|nr:PDZ domain-containing protein [Acidobacteriota bacterium]
MVGKVIVPVVAMLMLVPSVDAQTRDREVTTGLFMPFGRGATIGVSVREVAADEVSRAKLERPGGVYVVDVREGGPAAQAGLRGGDIVATFDGERVRSVRHFSRLVQETAPGRAVAAEIVRDGARQTLTVTPDASEPPFASLLPEIRREVERGLRTLPPDLPAAPGSPRGARARLGVTLAPLTDQLATYFGVKEGVLVSAVDARSPASRAGIRAGDVLTTIDGRAVRVPADVSASVRAAGRGGTLTVRLVRDRREMEVKVTLADDQPSTAQI